MKNSRTENEKLAREIGGLNENVTYHTVGSDKDVDAVIAKEKASKLEDASAAFDEKFKAHEQELLKTAEDLTKHVDLQIKPIGNYLLVKPFSTNPFQRITRNASGIITDLGGLTPEYFNNDNGQWEEEEQYVFQGTVVEVGPDVKWVKNDDIIMWCKPAQVPIPFYRLGLILVNETRVLCVINDDLNERF